jgi:DNA-binding transcriptional MerR regulator
MTYRVEQLAAAADVSVDTVRYYQAQRLLPPPRRQGRLALYGEEHVERIREVRALQRKGLTLAAIRRVLEGRLGAADQDLAAAVAAVRAEDGTESEELLTLEELAQRSGVAAPLLQAFERAGVRLGRAGDAGHRYTGADVEMVRLGLRLLQSGLPLPELLDLARDHDLHVRAVAERAVELFDDHIRARVRATVADDAEAAERLVTAFREIFPAVTRLVAHHFRRVLLDVAEEHIERVGDHAEVEATRAEARRGVEAAWPA